MEGNSNDDSQYVFMYTERTFQDIVHLLDEKLKMICITSLPSDCIDGCRSGKNSILARERPDPVETDSALTRERCEIHHHYPLPIFTAF